MPRPIDAGKREAILADIRAEELSCRAIADKHEVGASTVSRIAKDAGLGQAWARTQTKNATEARRLDNAQLRAEVSRTFLEKSRQLLAQMDEPHTAFNFGGKDNTYIEHAMERPPVDALRNLMITSATAFDKHLKAEAFDGEHEGLSAVDAWLRGITDS